MTTDMYALHGTFFIYDLSPVCNQSSTTGVTSGSENTDPSGAQEFIPGFQWGSCGSSFSFMTYHRFVTRVARPFRSTRVHPRFLVGFVWLDLQFYVQWLLSLFVLFHLSIVLFVILRFIASDYRLVSSNLRPEATGQPIKCSP